MLKKTSSLLLNNKFKFVSPFLKTKNCEIPCRLVHNISYNDKINISSIKVNKTDVNNTRDFSKKLKQFREELSAQNVKDEEDESDGENNVDEKGDNKYFNRTFPEDKNLPFNFRERKHVVNSPRVDSVLGSGLNISRNKVNELFLGSKVKLNGKKVLKKSIKMEDGDYAEATVIESSGTKVKRVRILGMVDKGNGRFELYLRSWKGGIEEIGSLEGGNWT